MIVKVLLTCVGGGLAPQMITLFRKSKRYHLDIVGTDIFIGNETEKDKCNDN